MSNANVDFVKEHFKDEKYIVNVLVCKRTINSKDPSATTEELIIKHNC